MTLDVLVPIVLLACAVIAADREIQRLSQRIDALERPRIDPQPSGDTQVPPATDSESTT